MNKESDKVSEQGKQLMAGKDIYFIVQKLGRNNNELR